MHKTSVSPGVVVPAGNGFIASLGALASAIQPAQAGTLTIVRLLAHTAGPAKEVLGVERRFTICDCSTRSKGSLWVDNHPVSSMLI
jgi:hypothetical protein